MIRLSRKPRQSRPGLTASVIGGGAWGTALAQSIALAGHNVLLWDRDDTVVQDIEKTGENRKRHPGFSLSPNITPTSDLQRTAEETDIVIIALPSEANQSVADKLAAHLGKKHTLVIAGKGFRERDGALLSTVWRQAAPKLGNIAVVTGPTFAREMMEEKITAMLIAAEDAETRARVATLFENNFLRAYESADIIGAQIGGAIKNILAIGSGVLDGLDMGNNARAALLTRGLVEMGRYTRAMGGNAQTIWGLAGMGDLLLTATSTLSRNYRFGHLVGRGTAVAEARLKTGTVEGVMAARIVTVQAQSLGIDLAIVSAIDGILHGDVSPLQVIEYLMQRPRVEEFAA